MEPRQLPPAGKLGKPWRWHPGVAGFVIAFALANAILYQVPLYAFATAQLDVFSVNGVLTLATLFILTCFVTALVLSAFALLSTRLLKPLSILIVLGNAVALYFTQTYGVVLDKSMMGNLFNTNVAEAGSFLHPRLLIYLLAFGVLPSWLLSRVRIGHTRLLRRVALVLVILLTGAGWFYANAKTWLWIDKNASRLGGMILPWSYVFNSSRYYSDHLQLTRKQTLLPEATARSDRPTIVILVIGESARAQNFSLYGYRRPTNPLLATDGVTTLPGAQACATYTTAAVACILSPVESGVQFRRGYEPLPSYLARNGIDVIWRTNNWGEPPMKVQSLQRADELRRDCRDAGCNYDEVLLHGLEHRIRTSPAKKIFVVLHQAGSHGPSYFSKYPKQFDVFDPVCRSVDLDRCTHDELINAYDNTILYPDQFLHRTIGLLKTFPETATMLMYLSDHGESLGEYGLYLHGTPYSIAPDVQKDIPFLIWMSDRFKTQQGITTLTPDRQARYSPQYVFHSVMGAFDRPFQQGPQPRLNHGDQLAVEDVDILDATAGDQVAVDHHRLVDPLAAASAHCIGQRRHAGQRATRD